MIKFILEISVCPTKNERGNPVEQNVGMSNVSLEKNILQKKEEVVWISSEARTDKKPSLLLTFVIILEIYVLSVMFLLDG